MLSKLFGEELGTLGETISEQPAAD